TQPFPRSTRKPRYSSRTASFSRRLRRIRVAPQGSVPRGFNRHTTCVRAACRGPGRLREPRRRPGLPPAPALPPAGQQRREVLPAGAGEVVTPDGRGNAPRPQPGLAGEGFVNGLDDPRMERRRTGRVGVGVIILFQELLDVPLQVLVEIPVV